MTGTIEALGLIYTNVEAKDSPTGQRGFQVWQASAKLSAEARKEVSRRVDDYRLPTGTPPEAAADFARDAYFALSDKAGGGFAVARSVPLAGKDKFGRGGRFLAHVLVVSADDFAALRHDPFALFDAATFHSGEPEQLAKEHPEWQKGVLPDVTLTPVVATGGLPEGDVRSKLAGHVDRDAAQRKTVVVVAMPAAVAAVLRTIYRGLPPALRASSEFDTMSAGSSLTQVPCAFAGCPTAAVLKMWAFRRFVTFTPPGTFTPPSELQKPQYELRAALPGTAAWAGATDCARAAAWSVAAAIEAKRPDDAAAALEAEGGPAALAILEGVPAFAATVEKARRDWLAGCPAVVADVPGVRVCLEGHLAVPLAQQMRRLREGLPRPRIADIVLHAVTLNGYGGDAPELLGHIQDWLGKDHGDGSAGRRLNWALSRLRGRDAPELVEVLTTGEDEDAVWFRDWIREHAEVNGITATKLCQGLHHDLEDAAIDRQQLYDAELYLLCKPTEIEEFAAMKELRFRHAYRTGSLGKLLTDGELPKVEERLGYLKRRAALGWTVLSDGTYFAGAFVYPTSPAETQLLQSLNGVVTGRQAMPTLYPDTVRNAGGAPPVLSDPAKYLTAFLDKLAPKGRSLDAERMEVLRQEFAQGGDFVYLQAVGFLLDKMLKASFVELGSEQSTLEAALFGLRLKWIDQNAKNMTQMSNLLELVLGANLSLDRHVRPSAQQLRQRDPADFATLLSWM